ncbi:hypothetical protein PARHAE_03188 [Paracoccus haematequi]|uniref:Lipoprotein n=1 Tax=Paracoccus haematequi TaxID=2491866 RepID=A0A447IR74_9RHOB|nr:hypothetical protein [Paracoccus haematequi]VDS09978.1 hypothetical protein PARHAE_03188 [Paracoccus haematequi]
MKMLSATLIASTVVLGACAPEPITRVETTVTTSPVDTEALATATGLPADAVLGVTRTGSQYVVFYREEGVTAEQLADAPRLICANTASTVFSADPVDTTAPQFGTGGVQRMTVTCA